jgi:hypothetical protein
VDADVGPADGAVEVQEHRRLGEIEVRARHLAEVSPARSREFTPLAIVGDGDDVLTVVRYRGSGGSAPDARGLSQQLAERAGSGVVWD